MSTPPPATVVYVVYGNDSIDLSWIGNQPAEVVVVHNDEHPTTVHGVSGTAVLRQLRPGENLGFGAGVGLAAHDASGRRLVVVNPDTRLTSAHWRALVDGSDDEVVTIPLVDEAGVPTYSVRRYPTSLTHVLGGFRAGRIAPRGSRRRGGPIELPTRDEVHPLTTHWASGAVLSLATERFRGVGGFDPAFFLYYEDVDLCRRLAAAHPSMQVRLKAVEPGVHTVGASAADGKTSEVERIRLRSAIRWASMQPGPSWRAAEWLLRGRQRLLDR